MKTARVLLLAASALFATSLHADDALESPRYQLTFLGGGSAFRGGQPQAAVGSAVPFQPDVTSPVGAFAFSVRVLGKLRAEGEVAAVRGRTEDGVAAPNNTFWSGGLAYPWLSLREGRLLSYLSLGGGVVERRVRDSFQSTVERAFEVGRTDPQAYGGAGVEWRFGRRFGLRGDYRYFRVFPGEAGGLAARESYGTHRFAGGLTLAY
jgi:hypothetical protein